MTKTALLSILSTLLVTLISFAAWAQDDSSKKTKEIPFEPEKIIYKTKSAHLRNFEILCEQRFVSPQREIILSFRINEKKKFRQNTTYAVFQPITLAAATNSNFQKIYN